MSRDQRVVLTVAVLASFVSFLDGTVVNVALPAISRDLGGGLSTQQWVVDAYLVTLGAFTFLTMWNDFMWPLIILSDDAKYTLPVALAILSGEHVQDTELMMAGSVLTILPVMVVFLALQRAYIRGIMAGSVKG